MVSAAADDSILSAGRVAPWLEQMVAALRGEGETDVPCGECVACCLGGELFCGCLVFVYCAHAARSEFLVASLTLLVAAGFAATLTPCLSKASARTAARSAAISSSL